MNATLAEFLLLAKRWMDSGANVAALFVSRSQPISLEPLAGAISFVVRGRVMHIDSHLSLLVISASESGMVSLGFEGAAFDFGTRQDLTRILTSCWRRLVKCPRWSRSCCRQGSASSAWDTARKIKARRTLERFG